MTDATSDATFLLRQTFEAVTKLAEKVADLVLAHERESLKFEQHVADDRRQFDALNEQQADILSKLAPIVSEQEFHERVKAAVDDSTASRRSWYAVVAQVGVALAAFCAIGVSIAAIFVTGHP